jgi:hypothetical protein
MTKVAIPEVKDALRRLTREACRDAALVAIAEARDAAESRRILEQRLGTSLAAEPG